MDNLNLTYLDPLPPAHGQAQADARRRLAKGRATAAWTRHTAAVDLNRDAQTAVEEGNRERRLRPEPGTVLHINRGRFVEVPTRREFPYGPVRASVPVEPRVSRLKAALLALSTALTIGRKEK